MTGIETSYKAALELFLVNCKPDQWETAERALQQIREGLEYMGTAKYTKKITFALDKKQLEKRVQTIRTTKQGSVPEETTALRQARGWSEANSLKQR